MKATRHREQRATREHETAERAILDALGDQPLPSTISLRGLVVVAHPDDEVIGAGARLARWPDVTVVHVTDGAPRDMRDARALGLATRAEYAALRRGERSAALQLAGIAASRVHDLDHVDQEASRNLVALTAELVALLRALVPDVVLTHPYEGGHPDHDATAFAVHAAVRLLHAEGAARPVIVEMSSYHMGRGGMATGDFLPDVTRRTPCRTPCRTRRTPLDAGAAALKAEMLACHASQRATVQRFRSDIEPVRLAPDYDFECAPHAGPLFYDHFSWGVTGPEWRALAREALHTLGLAPARSAAA